MISFILNFPYTLFLFIAGLTCGPKYIRFNKTPFAIVVKVDNFWWKKFVHKHSRAMAAGNCVLLGPREEEHDLEHELIHVRQHTQLPFVYPIFYYIETLKHGYRKNKFEDQAYRISGSNYRGK